MSGGMANLMNVNGSLSSKGEPREFQLSQVNSLPKLDKRGLRVVSTAMPSARAGQAGTVLLARQGESLPEIATDVIDHTATYAVRNVKCDRSNDRRGVGVGLKRLLGEMLGGHRAARL